MIRIKNWELKIIKKKKNRFIDQGDKYIPKKLRVIFIFESPSAHKGYFYDDTSRSSEILYRSLTKCLLCEVSKIKSEGLRGFADKGYLLVNAIYKPVNKIADKDADKLILNNYYFLKNDLKNIINNRKIKIILIKKNICNLLKRKLLIDGFNVLNDNKIIPFPMHYHYNSFCKKIRKLLKFN